MRKEETCCFTGHRPAKLPWGEDERDPRCLALKERLAAALEAAYAAGARHFICGMAQGSDFYFCEAALGLRERRDGVTVEAALPCQEQAGRWSQRDRQRYFALIGRCDYETLVQRAYDRQCMQRRDRYMVDRSSRIIAVYGGSGGGTLYTLAYAVKQGLDVNLLSVEEA